MTIYITISYPDHRLKPAYSKIETSPENIRKIISWACRWQGGRCYQHKGRYLKLFLTSICPVETMNMIKDL